MMSFLSHLLVVIRYISDRENLDDLSSFLSKLYKFYLKNSSDD